jgi:hypothetical protein
VPETTTDVVSDTRSTDRDGDVTLDVALIIGPLSNPMPDKSGSRFLSDGPIVLIPGITSGGRLTADEGIADVPTEMGPVVKSGGNATPLLMTAIFRLTADVVRVGAVTKLLAAISGEAIESD